MTLFGANAFNMLTAQFGQPTSCGGVILAMGFWTASLKLTAADTVFGTVPAGSEPAAQPGTPAPVQPGRPLPPGRRPMPPAASPVPTPALAKTEEDSTPWSQEPVFAISNSTKSTSRPKPKVPRSAPAPPPKPPEPMIPPRPAFKPGSFAIHPKAGGSPSDS
jgi:hypothetical protein